MRGLARAAAQAGEADGALLPRRAGGAQQGVASQHAEAPGERHQPHCLVVPAPLQVVDSGPAVAHVVELATLGSDEQIGLSD